MKRVISICLVLALAVTVGSSVFAAGFSGVNSSERTEPLFLTGDVSAVKDKNGDPLTKGSSIKIPLGYSAMIPSEENIADVNKWLNDNVSVMCSDGKTAELKELFDTELSYEKYEEGTPERVMVTFTIKKRFSEDSKENEEIEKKLFSDKKTFGPFKVGLVNKEDEEQATPEANRGTLSGITVPAFRTIDSINESFPTQSFKDEKKSYTGTSYPPLSTKTGDGLDDYYTLRPIPEEVFQFSSFGTKTPNLGSSEEAIAEREAWTTHLGKLNIKLEDNTYLDARLLGKTKEGLPYVQVWAKKGTPKGEHTAKVVVSCSDGTKATVYNASIVVTDDYNAETDPKLTGDLTNYDSAYSATTQVVTINPGSSHEIALPSGIFTYADGVTKALKWSHVAEYGLTVSVNSDSFEASLVEKNGVPYIRLTAKSSAQVGTYTNLIVTLAGTEKGMKDIGGKAAMNYTVTVAASEITGNKITGIDSNASLGQTSNGIWGRASLNGNIVTGLEDLEVVPGDVLMLEFNSDFFEWENGKPNPAGWVSKSNINSGKITVKILNGKNSNNVIDSAEMKYQDGRAYVAVYFTENFVSTKAKDFAATIALVRGGTANRDSAAKIGGTIENEYLELYDGDDDIDLSDGTVAIAMESIKNIQFYLGEDVYLNAKLSKNKKVYGTASTEPSSADEDMMDKYPAIEHVISLTTVGLNGSGNTVEIDFDEKYHVYNGYMEYLGTTDDKLDYYVKYYLSTTKLDVVEGGDGTNNPNIPNQAPILETEPLLPNNNSSTSAPGNQNQNPNTGW